MQTRVTDIKNNASAINEIQKERGLTSAYIGSNGITFQKELPLQREKTDKAFNNLKNIKIHLELLKLREDIDNLKISTVHTLDRYSSIVSKLQDTYLTITININNSFITNNLQAYTNLSFIKESLGQLRGAFNGVFSKKNIDDKLYYKIVHAKGILDVSKCRFNSTSSSLFLQKYQYILTTPEYKWVTQIILDYTINKQKNLIMQKPDIWFSKITKITNMLYDIEKDYLQTIQKYIDIELKNKLYEIYISIFTFLLAILSSVWLSLKIKNNIERNIKLLNEYKNAVDRSSIVSKTNKRGIITYVNDKFCTISGYKREELIGKPHSIVRDQSMPKSAFKNMWNTILSKKPWFGIVTNKTKDGGNYTVEVTINPILSENGEIEEFIAIRNDITDIIKLHKEIEYTQEDLIYRMGEISETRNKETGHHVKRVAKYSELLGRYYGLSNEDIKYLTYASPMHDIGKVGIPDSILNKPGKLTPQEWNIMKSHSSIGYELFKDSKKPLLEAAATIAYEHHEKYDGSGYPRGLKGENIHIYGRITALADVFDALGSDRCYKKAWDDKKIFELIKKERGRHFDPDLVDIFFKNLDSFLEIRDCFSDKSSFMKD